ncbi:MAG: hypothetical protein JRI72_00120 [Deltaproteobacteria bacterium]|nr:hypothetical protein [Deltaproteobacteria bacterium]
MFILNTKIVDNDYSRLNVAIQLIPIEKYEGYNLNDNFYGGRVQCIGKMKDSPVLLLINNQIDGLQVVDTAINELEDLSLTVLKKIAKGRKLKLDYRHATKIDVVKALKESLHEVKKAA